MKKTLLFLIFFLHFLVTFGQNPSDVEHAYGSIPGFNGNTNDIVIQPDGKIIVGGSFDKFQGKFQNHLIRLNSDGTKDNTFNIGSGFTGNIYDICLQPDGKIIVGGVFNGYQGKNEYKLIRLNSDGSKDESFKIDNGFNTDNSSGGIVYSIELQSDGKIIVGGDFKKYKGLSQNYLIRLNSDGSKDSSFNIGTGFNNIVRSLKLQNDGQLVIGGGFTAFNGSTQNHLIRLNNDGSKDNSLNIGTGFNGVDANVYTIEQQNDGKLLIGGGFSGYQGTTQNRLIRLNSDGSKDSDFNVGSGFNSTINAINLQPDGKILLGGSFNTYQGVAQNDLIRLNPDGSKDTTLQTGTGFYFAVFSIAQQTDGQMIIGGYFTSYKDINERYLIRLNSNGDKDNSFNIGNGFNDDIRCMALQSDGKQILGGYFNSFQTVKQLYFTRTDTEGNLDKTFNVGTGFNDIVWATAVQSDQKILVGGGFSSYNGTPEPYLIRLNSDGSKDKTFNIGSGFNSSITSILVQKDEKILVKGLFTSFQGNTQKYLMRLNQDGSRDTSFNINNEFLNNEISYVFLQSDGKILITSNLGIDKVILIRLNNDGSQDNTFNMTLAQSKISSIAQQNDGKIIIGSQYKFYNGDPKQYLIRLNSDGTKDLTFNNSNEFVSPINLYSTEVTSIVIQNDGKIIAAGYFPNELGLRSGVIRLNSDGSADTTFNLKSFHSDGITSMTLEPNGKIIIGGGFELYDGSDGYNDSAFLIRLFGTYVATPIVPVITSTNITCDVSSGSASIDAYGGKSPYTYLWSNGATTKKITGLIAGNYSCTVTDADATSVTATFNISTIQTEKLTITAPINVSVNIDSGCTVTGVVLGTPLTSDNCSGTSVTNDAPKIFPLGNTTVTWIVTDGSNNTATATQIVTVKDAILPTIKAPADIVVNTNTNCTATNVFLGNPITADNCSIVSVTNDAPTDFPTGNTTVTWTVKDASNNTATVTQIVTVKDITVPTIKAPAAITVNTNTNCTATNVVLGNPVTADNCSIVSVTNDAPTDFPTGNTTVTWTVKDASNNTATATQIVTVKDVTLPTIKAPAAITVNTNTNCTATNVVLGNPVTTDNCSVASVINDAPTVFSIGNTTVTWTVKDASNNTAMATQIVTVKDITLPTIKAPAAITVNTNTNCTATNVVLGNPVTTDNCSVASVINDAPTVFSIGNTTVTWTVKDASNNTATATQIVTVKGIDTIITNNSGILTAIESEATYKWLECNNGTFTVIANENKASFTPKKAGSYAVEIAKNGCTATSTCYEVQTLGNKDFELEYSLKLYPNPTKDFIIIEMNTLDNTKLKIFDVNGQFIFSKELTTTTNTVNISHLASGIYMFQISNELGSVIKKVIKK